MYSASSASVICSPVEENTPELNSEIYKGTHDNEICRAGREGVGGSNAIVPSFFHIGPDKIRREGGIEVGLSPS